jgi:AcrR family transcriptional regulator
MGTRKYDQRDRADAAQETRRRILDAVYKRLRAAPTEPVSIERVAAIAGVSRSTVYLVFGTRAGLFDALGTDIRKSGGFDRPVDLEHVRDVRETLLESIRASVPIFAKHRDVLRALYSMSHLDADAVGGAVHRMGKDRAAALTSYAQLLARRKELRPGVTPGEAAHLLWAFTGFEFFDQLYTGRALSADAVAELMVAATERAVLRTIT